MKPDASGLGLVAASALHLGFQVTVTAVVYPALVRVPPEQWSVAHRAHSSAITPVVGLVYGSVVAAGAWALRSRPTGWTIASLAGATLAVSTTALVAAPAHQRLAGARDSALIRRLLRADRIRTAAAAIAVLAAARSALPS
jgi:hypothetical protein